ncbi:hypothetical protein BH11PSE11_BH11PSE11_03050 [soil metagenome]
MNARSEPTIWRQFLVASIVSGIAAGIFSTLVQIVFWILFTDAFPAILWRDTGLTAALVLGPGALGATGIPDLQALIAASVIHFGLSTIYAAIMGALASPLGQPWYSAAGVLMGLGLYVVNLYGFTLLFPWFEAARDWITVVAHAAFGVSAVLAFRWQLGQMRYA